MAGAALTATAAAESVGFRDESLLVHDAKAAYDNKYTNIQWNTEAAENVGAPVVYKDSVLLPVGDMLLRYSEADGMKLAEIKLPSAAAADFSGVMYGDILVQPLENGICTVDMTTAEVKTLYEADGTVDSDVAVADGIVYFSVRNADGEHFCGVSLTDGSLYQGATAKGQDMTSPTKQGDSIIVGMGDVLATHTEGYGVCEIPVGGVITGAPYASEYAVYFSTEGNVVKLRLNSDGTMEEDTLVTCETGADSSAPLQHNNRLYVTSDKGLHIIDSINMELITTLPDIAGGSDPFLCRGNGPRVYTVAPYEGGRWALYSVYDPGEEVEPQTEILAIMENFEGGKAAVSENGTMYYRDALGRLYALTLVEYNIVMIIIRLLIMVALIAGVFIWIRMVGKRRAQNRFG